MTVVSMRSLARRTGLAAVAVLAGCATLLTAACDAGQAPSAAPPSAAPPSAAPPSAAPPSAVVPSLSASPSVLVSPSASVAPQAGGSSIAKLPGWLYYADGERVLRLTRSGVEPVPVASAFTANLSPDGTTFAFVDDGDVVVDRDGQNRRTVLPGPKPGVGFEPAWSPDSRRLLVAKGPFGKTTIGILTVASGAFTPLPGQLKAIHLLWSADGRHLGYATGTCQIGVADADGRNAHLVPVFGAKDRAKNPQRRRSCDPFSISPDGRMIAVNQRTGSEPDGDIGRDLFANAVIDTRTGANVSLPVTGAITAVLFQPDGGILVRTKGPENGPTRLTLLNADRKIKAQVTEPAAVLELPLLAYARK